MSRSNYLYLTWEAGTLVAAHTVKYERALWIKHARANGRFKNRDLGLITVRDSARNGDDLHIVQKETDRCPRGQDA